MYPNLLEEIANAGITQNAIAEYLGIHKKTIKQKISGTRPFTIEEAFRIKEHFFPKCELRYLFNKAIVSL